MRNLICLLAVFGFLNVSVFAQDLQKKAQENPLDCALYLATKSSKGALADYELRTLASFLWKLNRFDDAVKTIDLMENDYGRTDEYILYSSKFLENQNAEQAAALLLKAAKITKEYYDNEQGEPIIRGLFKLNKSAQAIEYAELTTDKDDKAFALILIADLLTDKKLSDDAIKFLPQALDEINETEWFDFKIKAMAKSANVYAKNGKKESSLKLIEEVERVYLSIEYVNRFDEQDIFELIVECYTNLQDYETAFRLLEENQKVETNEKFLRLAKLESKAGNEEKANTILLQIKQINSSGADNDYALSKTIDDFIKTDDLPNALESAKQIHNDYYKFKIVDEFIKIGRNDLATELLNHIWANVREIKAVEKESGNMSTSPQMIKADYLSQIAGKFLKIGQAGTALKIINSIEKPYFKAQALTDFASIQKSKNSPRLLNQALAIMQKTKDSTLDARREKILNEIALGYAEIGQNSKAAQLFAEILTLNPKDTSQSEVIETLSETGYYFEKSGLKSNLKTNNALEKVIKNWEEENY